MADIGNSAFLVIFQKNIFLIVFQCFIVAAAWFFKRQPNAPRGLDMLMFGFCFLIAYKIFFLASTAYDSILFTIFEMSSFSLAIGMFVTAALLLRGIKAVNLSFACILSLLLFSFISYAVFFTDTGYLKYVLLYLSLGLAFGFLSFGFMPRSENKSIYGFYLSSLSLLALSIISFMMISGWGRSFFGINILILLYFVVAVSFLLASANLLENKISSLEEEVANSRQRLRLLVQSSPFPIIISRLKDEKILLLNNKAEDLLGIKMDNLPFCRLSDFIECNDFKQKLLSRLEKTKDIEDFEVKLSKAKVPLKHAGTWLSFSSHIIDFEYEIALYSVVQDITTRKQKEMELFNEATKDSLTNCYTRRFFEELTSKEIVRSIHNNNPFCFLMIDADYFKNINDTYGHDVGDKVLKALADTCHKVLRGSDIICRFGGEEFLIMLSEIDIHNAEIIANRLREAIGRLILTGNNGESIRFTVSMGLAPSSYSTDYHSLVTAADNALYQAKNSGRNKVMCFKDNTVTVGSK